VFFGALPVEHQVLHERLESETKFDRRAVQRGQNVSGPPGLLVRRRKPLIVHPGQRPQDRRVVPSAVGEDLLCAGGVDLVDERRPLFGQPAFLPPVGHSGGDAAQVVGCRSVVTSCPATCRSSTGTWTACTASKARA
jgi:hypothetical protein